MNTTQETTHSTGNIHVEIHFLFGWFASVKDTQSQWVGKKGKKEKKARKNEWKRKIVLYFYWKCVFGSWTKMLYRYFACCLWWWWELNFISFFFSFQSYSIIYDFFSSTSYKCILLDMHECYQSPILFIFDSNVEYVCC